MIRIAILCVRYHTCMEFAAFPHSANNVTVAGALERVGEFQRKLEDVRKKLVCSYRLAIRLSLERTIITSPFVF